MDISSNISNIKNTLIHGDALEELKKIPNNSIHCCITSPPYYGLRDYEVIGQVGREDTPEQYIEHLVLIFNEVFRVLRPDGTLWLNISDTYCGTGNKANHVDPKNSKGRTGQRISLNRHVSGCKNKDLLGIPWMLAFALRSQGWYLRNDIIWNKSNPMPESVRDRCTRSYEHIFLLAKSRKYYFDSAAIAEPAVSQKTILPETGEIIKATRNRRDVWHINTVPFRGNHYATFPPQLVKLCILAGCPVDGIVLDPFIGSGTTAQVAKQMGRIYIGIEIKDEYCSLANKRISSSNLRG